MKITGIIAEYNPFHNGHAHQIEKSRAFSDNIICLMSGNFTQRGEPAIADKWQRTRLALSGGADLVIELPFLYAIQSAEKFAAFGVKIFNELNCIDNLCFGSENGQTEALERCARVLLDEQEMFTNCLHENLNNGDSFAKAREKALCVALNEDVSSLVSKSNNILGIEYIKALMAEKSKIKPITIKRMGSNYNDSDMHPVFPSATSVREELKANGFSDALSMGVPKECVPYYDFEPLTDTTNYFNLVMFSIRKLSLEELSEIYEVGEGLEFRIKKAAMTATNLESLIDSIKTKRYTKTRINRILLNCVMSVTKKVISMVNFDSNMLYARVLGYKKEKSALLSHVCKNSKIPVILKAKDFVKNELFMYDILATDIYSMLGKNILPAAKDYTGKLIVL